MSRSAVRTAVIPAAGLGTRFLPVTKAVPKEMLPLVDRPCIEYIVAEAVEAGIERIVLVSATGKEAMVDYFGPNPHLEAHLEATGKGVELAEVRRISNMAEIVVVLQEEAKGLGHAVYTARECVGDAPFAVLLGDDIMDSDPPAISQLIAAHNVDQAVVGLLEVPLEDTRRYGICAGPFDEAGRMQVREMVEKPEPADAPSRFGIVGRYVLPPDIFEILGQTKPGRGGEIQLTDALATLASQGRVTGVPLFGTRLDTGNVMGLLRATLHYARKRPELRPQLDAILAEFVR
jgi:UTP--glucose-1-phosphate uridylyltransferase